MTRNEFETRAIPVTSEEFDHINAVYMESDIDKDEFCKIWVKMNASRVKAYKAMVKAQEREQALRDKMFAIYWKLHNEDVNATKFATHILNDKEKEILASKGIKMEGEWRKEFYNGKYIDYTMVPYYKEASSVRYEIGKYLGIF